MKKKFFLILIGLILLLGGTVFVVKNQKTKSQPVQGSQDGRIILYVGVTCPHCKEVEKWLEENIGTEVVPF
jgi:hypothetical protein